jgi:hypothetical protein
VDGISEFGFSYSLDDGETFLPIKTGNIRLPNVTIMFDPVFKSISAKIRCSAKSMKGFTANADT